MSDFVELAGHTAQISNVAISSDSHWLVTGDNDGKALIWDLTADVLANSALELDYHGGFNFGFTEFSSDNRWLVVGTSGRLSQSGETSADVYIVNLTKPLHLTSSRRRLECGSDLMRSVSISPDSRWLVGSGTIWDLTADDVNGSVKKLNLNSPTCAAFSSDSRRLFTGHKNGEVRILDLAADAPVSSMVELKGHADHVRCLTISPDNRWLVSGASDNRARIWDLTVDDPSSSSVELNCGAQDHGSSSGVNCLSITLDSKKLVTGSDTDLRLWRLTSNEPENSMLELKYSYPIRCMAISSDNRFLATASGRGVLVWDLSIDTIPGRKVFDGDTMRLAFSPDKRWLVTGSERIVRVWPMSDISSGPFDLT